MQTLADFDVWVVSDGDPGDYFNRASRKYSGDPRFKFLCAPRSGSAGLTRQYGVDCSSSRYISYLDHDDEFDPCWLERALLCTGDEAAQWVVSGAEYSDIASGTIESPGIPLSSITWSEELQALNALFEPSRVVMARTIQEDAGRWSPFAWGLEDWDMWWRVARLGCSPHWVSGVSNRLARHDEQRRNVVGARFVARILDMPDAQSASEACRKLQGGRGAEAFRIAIYETVSKLVGIDVYTLAALDPFGLPSPVVMRDQDGWGLGLPVATVSRRHSDRVSKIYRGDPFIEVHLREYL